MSRRFELRHLDAFLALCETLHFGKASERLNMSQSALSRAIQHLEIALSAQLFSRDNRNVTLTEAGMVLREDAGRLLKDVDDARDRVRLAREGRAGRLSIAYIDFVLSGVFPEAVQRFRHANPRVDIQLVRMPTDIQFEALRSGEVEIGVLLGKCSSAEISSIMVEEQSFVALVPTRHPLAAREEVAISDVLREPLVLGSLPEYSAFRRKLLAEAQRLGIRPHIIQEASTSDGIFALVGAGVGVSLYAHGRSQIARAGVAVRRVTGGSSDLDIHLAWNVTHLSPAAANFIQTLTRRRRTASGAKAR